MCEPPLSQDPFQTGIFCNVSGDSRLAVGSFFPLTVQVPVGLTALVSSQTCVLQLGSCLSSLAHPHGILTGCLCKRDWHNPRIAFEWMLISSSAEG